ncbi:DUF4139 domain-containing protein [Rhizobacter sp. Root16D2]|uniref:DUF4139 domain-containing protein n=1 Tax=Rhizobacter sp. Root16D2 TaxID=1736479 RepID=UPI0009E7F2BD|nr:DUF4139 domain-containing protein [Rhizobacter sp. Root16D2]
MPALVSTAFRTVPGLLASLFLLGAAAAESRIARVTVYAGSATVERVARAPAGSRTLSFDCLPAGLDVQSLQVSADAGVRIGETSVLMLPRASAPRCAAHVLDGRIRELEERKDALQAEAEALGFVTGYLKDVSAGSGGEPAARRGALDPKTVVGKADALRRTGQDALLQQSRIARRKAELERELAPLQAERARSQGSGGQVATVTVTLATASDADVTLSYQVRGPGWTPSYRALLDSASRQVRIERQALVAQATGEDWRGVKLLLSTGQPRHETTGRLPSPWRLGIEAPPVPQVRNQLARDKMAGGMLAAPAAAPMATEMEARQPLPQFDASVFDGAFATQFSVPQPIDVPSSGERVTMTLGQHEDRATLAVRTAPQLDASAFLVADLPVPAGVWPAGPMQLYRDGAFVGQGRWDVSGAARLSLSFGRDDLVRVSVAPERDTQGSSGFTGNRSERKLARAYTIENRHTTPISLQVLEAAPVSVDEQVKVAVQFAPQPADLAWQGQPGVASWTLDVPAGGSARVAADYVISHPKELRLTER